VVQEAPGRGCAFTGSPGSALHIRLVNAPGITRLIAGGAGGRVMRALRVLPLLTVAIALILAPGEPGGATESSSARASAAAKTVGSPASSARRQPPVAETGYLPPAMTLLATADGSVPAFAAPGGSQTGRVPGTWHAAPSTLPVIAAQAGWLEVRLAQRPNETTTWVRASDVTLSTTAYAIVIDLATTHLMLYQGGRLVFSAPVGVGTVTDPTPTGQFFVAFLAASPAPGYGPFVMVTSAHSNAITDWDMSGDAMVAIHGPLGADAQIGSTGARVSHGCIRLHDADLLRLRDVPAGSPVIILPSEPLPSGPRSGAPAARPGEPFPPVPGSAHVRAALW
jgi:lipoprotein-anchoring transpeptidase ErfK/SrfK